MNTIAETGSRPEIRKYARPRAMLGEFSAQKAPKSSGKRVLVRELTRRVRAGNRGLKDYAAPLKYGSTQISHSLSSHSGM
jgi:hypothetical protein